MEQAGPPKSAALELEEPELETLQAAERLAEETELAPEAPELEESEPLTEPQALELEEPEVEEQPLFLPAVE